MVFSDWTSECWSERINKKDSFFCPTNGKKLRKAVTERVNDVTNKWSKKSLSESAFLTAVKTKKK